MQPRTVRLPEYLWDALDEAARQDHRSSNMQIIHILATQLFPAGVREAAPQAPTSASGLFFGKGPDGAE